MVHMRYTVQVEIKRDKFVIFKRVVSEKPGLHRTQWATFFFRKSEPRSNMLSFI